MSVARNSQGEKKGPDRSLEANADAAMGHLTVRQPEKIRSLLFVLADLEKISEIVLEDQSKDMGSGGTSGLVGVVSGGQKGGTSLRDQAIRSLPSQDIMCRRLTRHLAKEVRQLEFKVRRISYSTKKGSAYLLNDLYAQIRKIQSLIIELADAATEVVRRLFIRLFIDHQQLV